MLQRTALVERVNSQMDLLLVPITQTYHSLTYSVAAFIAACPSGLTQYTEHSTAHHSTQHISHHSTQYTANSTQDIAHRKVQQNTAQHTTKGQTKVKHITAKEYTKHTRTAA